MGIYKEAYGETQQGELVYEYTIANSSGMKVSVLNLGGIITRLLVPDRHGNFQNIVLALDSLQGYVENPAYVGAIVGRYAGRIKDSAMKIGGKEYQLDRNDGNNSLHGGFKGLNKVIWTIEEKLENSEAELRLAYLSRDGEGGFPGNLKINATYRVHEDNSLEIIYEAISDKETAVSLTNHSYFNLSGDIETIEEHDLRLNTPFLLEAGADMLAGERILDLRQYGIKIGEVKKIKEYMLALEKASGFKGMDHAFIVNKGGSKELSFTAEYQHQGSGRSLAVYTDLPYINIYSGNFLDEGITLAEGKSAVKYGGICFETQEQPDGPHNLGLGYRFLKPNELYKRTTVFKFSIK